MSANSSRGGVCSGVVVEFLAYPCAGDCRIAARKGAAELIAKRRMRL
jgi:hypothetical protein